MNRARANRTHRRLPFGAWAAAGLFALLAAGACAPAASAHEALGPSIEAISRRIAAEPGNAELLLRRAELRRLARSFEAAGDDLARAGFLAPKLPGLTTARAALALDRGAVREALDLLAADEAPEAERGVRSALRARALAADGRAAEAVSAWDDALASLENPQPDDFLARARLQVSLGRPAAARAGLREARARLGPAASLTRALEEVGGEAADGDAGRRKLAPADVLPFDARGTPPLEGAVEAVPSLLAVTISRGPYLQSVTQTGITVRWRITAASDGRVWYGTAPGVYSGYVDDPASATEHSVTLSGLAAGTRYYYAVGSSAGAVAGGDSLTFKTLPPAGASMPVRIWAIGDSGIPGAAQSGVRDAFLAWTGSRGADVWLMLGDNAYSTGLDTEYQSGLFAPYRAQLQRWPLWPTRGNHDVTRAGADNDYYDFFTLPAAGQSGGVVSGTEAYYSFDYGPVHFICLDSEGSDRSASGPMMIWLASDLAANTRAWTIAFFHHPPYTKGSHDSDDAADSGGRMRDMRQNALPVLEAAGADLVLGGHSHSYERSFLLDGHYGTSGTLLPSMKKNAGDGRPNGDGVYAKPGAGSAPHQGAVYAVDGSAAQISGGTLDHPAMVSALNVLGSMVIDVDGDRLDARFLSNTGAVLDSFAIVKGAATAVRGDRPAVDGLELGPALPNPFRAGVSLSFTLKARASVRLAIFDAGGRRVATLARGDHAAGTHSVHWDGTGHGGRALPAGIYVAILDAGGRRVTRRLALVR